LPEPSVPRAAASQRSGRVGAALLALVLLASMPAVTTRLNASDEIQFFAWLHSWMFDGDVDFENEYQYFVDAGPGNNPGFITTFLETTNEAGRRPNFAPIGSAVLWLPFYGVGHVVAGFSGSITDGLSQPYIASIAYGSAVYGSLALLLSVSIVRTLFGRSGAGAAAVTWLGTPLLFYMYLAPGFSHACSAFAVALFIRTWLVVRQRWTIGGVVALGVAAALLPMVREQDVFFLAGPLLDFLAGWWRERTRGRAHHVRRLILSSAGAVACVVAYVPQLMAYQALNGHPGPTTLVARKMSWTAPHALGVVLSPEHGLFFWTPLAAVALAGLVWMSVVRRDLLDRLPTGRRVVDIRWVAALLLLMVILQVYVSGSVESWTVAGAFGQRRFVALTPVLVVGLTGAWMAVGRHRLARLAALVATLVLVWWNLGLVAQFGLHLMDRQRLTLRDNARITFLELPRRAPSVIVRYLTDRESFYGAPRR
jgi:hypothetical protein